MGRYLNRLNGHVILIIGHLIPFFNNGRSIDENMDVQLYQVAARSC